MESAAGWIDLSGKVAHVTGGGKGIGKGISTALAMAGAKVMKKSSVWFYKTMDGSSRKMCNDIVSVACGLG